MGGKSCVKSKAFSKNKKKHKGHLQIVLKKFEENCIIISKSKMQLFQHTIEFLGVIIGNGKILLQPYISEKILTFLDKIEETKELQKFIGLLNYARPFIKNLSRIAGPLFSKVGSKGHQYFNQEDIKLVKTLKDLVTKLQKKNFQEKSVFIGKNRFFFLKNRRFFSDFFIFDFSIPKSFSAPPKSDFSPKNRTKSAIFLSMVLGKIGYDDLKIV